MKNKKDIKKITMEDWYGVINALNPDRIIKRDEQWKDQFNRLKRWLVKVQDIQKNIKGERLSDDDFDYLIAFFQNCYHLRDWISNSRPDLENAIARLFKNKKEMKACRDICNGFKHKKLTSPSISDSFAFYREYDHFKEQTIYCIAFNKYNEQGINGVKKFDLFALAEKCFKIWEEFINGHLEI